MDGWVAGEGDACLSGTDVKVVRVEERGAQKRSQQQQQQQHSQALLAAPFPEPAVCPHAHAHARDRDAPRHKEEKEDGAQAEHVRERSEWGVHRCQASEEACPCTSLPCSPPVTLPSVPEAVGQQAAAATAAPAACVDAVLQVRHLAAAEASVGCGGGESRLLGVGACVSHESLPPDSASTSPQPAPATAAPSAAEETVALSSGDKWGAFEDAARLQKGVEVEDSGSGDEDPGEGGGGAGGREESWEREASWEGVSESRRRLGASGSNWRRYSSLDDDAHIKTRYSSLDDDAHIKTTAKLSLQEIKKLLRTKWAAVKGSMEASTLSLRRAVERCKVAQTVVALPCRAPCLPQPGYMRAMQLTKCAHTQKMLDPGSAVAAVCCGGVGDARLIELVRDEMKVSCLCARLAAPAACAVSGRWRAMRRGRVV